MTTGKEIALCVVFGARIFNLINNPVFMSIRKHNGLSDGKCIFANLYKLAVVCQRQVTNNKIKKERQKKYFPQFVVGVRGE